MDKAFELTKRFYDAQEAMKAIMGPRYPVMVIDTRLVIEAMMEAKNEGILAATRRCIEAITNRVEAGNGLIIAMLLATAVEMIEGQDE